MNWKAHISGLESVNPNIKFEFKSPIEERTLQELKLQFSLSELPGELVELFKQTNGIDETKEGRSIGKLIWSIEKVIDTNKEYRNIPEFKELYMSFEQILFVADAGNGDLYGFVTLNGKFDRYDIFKWDHELDSRSWVAPDLTKFIEWRINGIIKS